jgi:ubiquinol-cytochrome c reductase cytochrome b subunit
MFLNKLNIKIIKIASHILKYPTPININYFWSLGFLAGICLALQFLSGIFLAMFYIPNSELAFDSIEYIMRDVKNGWLIRYMHANTASFFFIILYLHIAKGLYFSSFIKSNKYIWLSGIILFILVMATAFLGYVLPWGQMSYWGATVITNFFSIFPFIGNLFIKWLWGGFAVSGITLTRFFALHFLLPFLILFFIIIHLATLHINGSSNPLGTDSINNLPFQLFFTSKDLHATFVFLFFLSFLIFYFPNLLGHPDNYILANSQITPTHIVPEWYFLPFYAILKSFTSKTIGVLMMFLAIIIVAVLPFFSSDLYIQAPEFKFLQEEINILLFTSFICLGYLGQLPPTLLTIKFSFIFSMLYFFSLIYGILNSVKIN